MPYRTRLAAPVLVAALALVGGACSDDAEDAADQAAEDLQEEAGDAVSSVSSGVDEGATDAAEAAARSLAATHGADEFAQAGHEIDGDLACEATVADGEDAIDVMCSGATTDGEEAALTGTTSELPGASATELEGDFTGTVAGTDVFTVDSLGGR